MTEGSRVLVAVRVRATADRAFVVFTQQIGQWWEPNGLFEFRRGRSGTLAFEPGPAGRLTETYDDGEVFEVGRVKVWDPPAELVVSWREANFAEDQETELRVRFQDLGDQTRVTVEHVGWDSIPATHAARHGFPLAVFQRRFAEWWQRLLADYAERV